MTDQPNPYSQPDETKGVLIGEAKTPTSTRRIWFWLAMGCVVVPLALFGLYIVVLLVYVVFFDGLQGFGV